MSEPDMAGRSSAKMKKGRQPNNVGYVRCTVYVTAQESKKKIMKKA